VDTSGPDPGGAVEAGRAVDDARPGSQASLRSANERRILEALREGGELTQAELSRRTGLAPATVSNIVHALRETGLVDVVGEEHRGRRGRGVRLAGGAGYVVGVDFGPRHVSVALANLAHDVVGEERRPLAAQHRYQDGLAMADDILRRLLAAAGASRTDVVGAGMTLPAPLDSVGREVGAPSVLPGWVGVHAPEVASARLGLEVHVDNDANLGALAEHLWGAGRGRRNLAYLTLGEGIGAGLVLDGHLFRGGHGAAGEIGHTTIDESGRVCRCGNRGCLETIVSSTQVLALLAQTHGPDLTIAGAVAAALRGDAGCRRILGDTGRTVGVAVANLCNILNPELILIGGELAQAGDLLLDPMRDVVARYGVPGAVRDVVIRTAGLGDRAELLGAVALGLRHARLGVRATA
jgi:predicted NBD/HSP70 family sugar kinase